MANFTKTTIQKGNRTELREKLSLTGAEISVNELPAGANVHLFIPTSKMRKSMGFFPAKAKQ